MADLDLEKARNEKQALVLETLRNHCIELVTNGNPIEDGVDSNQGSTLHLFGRALCSSSSSSSSSSPSKLMIENLAGGYTNFTYKVYVDDEKMKENNEELAVFVKLGFSRALWNPDPDLHYDVVRIANEYSIMESVSSILLKGQVARPLLLEDLVAPDGSETQMKLLVTEWSHVANEQLGNQFIDGHVDLRVADALAYAMASIHTMDMDDDFNTDTRHAMVDLFSDMEEHLTKVLSGKLQKELPRASEECEKLLGNVCGDSSMSGEKTIKTIFELFRQSYTSKEMPIHSDMHFFNVLVEPKPAKTSKGGELEDAYLHDTFGETGAFCICDWEMAQFGPIGVDLGRIYSIPVALALLHTYNDASTSVATGQILPFMDAYWWTYVDRILEVKQEEDGNQEGTMKFLEKQYRNGIAWLGWKLYAMSSFEWFLPFLPVQDDIDMVTYKDALAVTALRLMRWGLFDDLVDISGENFEPSDKGKETESLVALRQLHDQLHSLLQEEFAYLIHARLARSEAKKVSLRNRRRRSSVLRGSLVSVSSDGSTKRQTRRISDANLKVDRSHKRVSGS